MTIAERSEDAVTLRYWVALLSRSEIISEKLRHLLPGGVAAQLITSVLENSSTDFRMKEKVIFFPCSAIIFTISYSGYPNGQLQVDPRRILLSGEWNQ